MTTIVATLVLWVTSSSPSAMLNRAAHQFGVQSQQWHQWRVSFRFGDPYVQLRYRPAVTNSMICQAPNIAMTSQCRQSDAKLRWSSTQKPNSAVTVVWSIKQRWSPAAEEKCHSAADSRPSQPWTVEEDSGQETHTCTHTWRPNSVSSQ